MRSRTSEHRLVQRAKVLLLAADGVSNVEISVTCGVSRPTVLAWRAQFDTDGLSRFGQVARGRGRKASIPEERIAEIVDLTLHHKPDGETHWSCRSMAKRVGVSPATVQRVWSARGLKPHLVETFKISNDKRFEEKLIDVVGLYLNPPDKAVVLCMDEKSQIQALDRTQPSLPLKPGRAGTMTHDYVRNGTTNLYAALDVASGNVIADMSPRHRAEEFRRFLNLVDANVPAHLDVHVVLDNSSTHKTPAIQRWLARHPRFTLHFTPTYGSWLNLVERWFAELTENWIKRGAHRSVKDLVATIRTWITTWNENPKPYLRHKTADEILNNLAEYCRRINDSAH